MSCDTLRDAIVDVARGRDIGAGTVGAVEAHVEHCVSCRARFTREQQLTVGLRALARAKAAAGASAGVEAQLLAAFAAHRSASSRSRTFTSWWTRAAAGIALLAAGGVAWWIVAGSRLEESREVSTVATHPRESTRPPSDVRETPPPVPATVPVQAVAAAPSRQSSRQVRTTRRAASRIVRPEGFVALPFAAGLPAFESGEIVRLEVPVTSLPNYGIDIVPDVRGSAVEADFLVGQDGQARAIRLVRETGAVASAGSSRWE